MQSYLLFTLNCFAQTELLMLGNQPRCIVVVCVLCHVTYSTPHFVQSRSFQGIPLLRNKQGWGGGNYMFETQKHINRWGVGWREMVRGTGEGWKVVKSEWRDGRWWELCFFTGQKWLLQRIVNVPFVRRPKHLFPHLYIHVIIARLFYLWSVCNMCLWCEFVSLLMCFIEFLYTLIANV